MPSFLVDAMNVIGSRPTGWWRDRPAAVRRLVADLDRVAAASGDHMTVVVDGAPLHDLAPGPHGSVTVEYSRRRGRDAADDRIVELVTASPDPGSWTVVTSDRLLRDRVTRLGAQVVGTRALLDRIEGAGGENSSRHRNGGS